MTGSENDHFSMLLTLGGFCLALIAGVVTRDRYVLKRQQEGDDALHSRINSMRDKFVLRSDFQSSLDLLQAVMREIKDEQARARAETREDNKELSARLDKLIASSHRHLS